jgi:hypothetical protein
MRASNIFATGWLAFGFCDRCGQRYDMTDLKEQYNNRQPTGLFVCPPCLDIDHEQLRTDDLPAGDAIALENSRPDTAIRDSRNVFGWNPVRGLTAQSNMGNPRINT